MFIKKRWRMDHIVTCVEFQDMSLSSNRHGSPMQGLTQWYKFSQRSGDRQFPSSSAPIVVINSPLDLFLSLHHPLTFLSVGDRPLFFSAGVNPNSGESPLSINHESRVGLLAASSVKQRPMMLLREITCCLSKGKGWKLGGQNMRRGYWWWSPRSG